MPSVFSGQLFWPSRDIHVPSEFLDFSPGLGYVLTTLPIDLKDRHKNPGPLIHLVWKDKMQLEIADTFPPEAVHFHARNGATLPGARVPSFLIADHGLDADPFPGGVSTLYELISGKWEGKKLFPQLAFHFDVAVTGNIIPDSYLAAFTNLNQPHSTLSKISKTGEIIPIDIPLPEDLSFHNYMTLKFVDLNKDGIDELLVGGRGEGAKNSILEFSNGRFQYTSVQPPPPKFGGWESVMLEACDLDGLGNMDLIILSHDKSITQGAIEILRLGSGGYTPLKLPPEIDCLWQVPGQWIHRVKPVNAFHSTRKDLLLTLRRSDYGVPHDFEQVILLKNEGNGIFSWPRRRDSFLKTLVLGADVVVNDEGKPNLLVINFDGSYHITSLD